MALFSLEEILSVTKGSIKGKFDKVYATGVSTDSRKIEEGNVFIALKGETFDGHDFLEEAVKKKAAIAVVNRECGIMDLPCVEVDDTLKALQALAAFHRQRFSIPVIAITGSSGKTTTKELVATVVESSYRTLKTEKNFNNEIGLPLTLLQLNETHDACVVEMGMRGLGQIAELVDIAKPTMGIVTNVGTSHIELLKSQENIAKAKCELIKGIGEKGLAILNEDDPFVKEMECFAKGKVMGYGMEGNATVLASHLRYKKDGIKFTCKCYDEIFDVFLPMIGTHNVYNALAAIAVGRALGISSGKIKKALQSFSGIPMRQEIVSFDSFVILNDTYNANPASMKEAIKALGQLEGNRKVAILGDMLELGEQSVKLHREIGLLLGEEQYELLFIYGEESIHIAEAAKEGGVPKVIEGSSHKDIAQQYMMCSQDGDTVLLKGSRGMMMEAVLVEIEKIRGAEKDDQ